MDPFAEQKFDSEIPYDAIYLTSGACLALLIQTFSLLLFTVPMASYMKEVEKLIGDSDPDNIDTLDNMLYPISIFSMIQIGLYLTILLKLWYYRYFYKTGKFEISAEFTFYVLFAIVIFGMHAKVLDIARNYKSENYSGLPDLTNDLFPFKVTFAFSGLVPLAILCLCYYFSREA